MVCHAAVHSLNDDGLTDSSKHASNNNTDCEKLNRSICSILTMGMHKGVAAALCLLKMPTRKSIAIVGGGITGSCAAAELAEHFERVVVYDQGRRGPGGRASHRSVNAADGTVIADDSILEPLDATTFEFDHGCQFFRADSSEMKTQVEKWCENGWAAPWNGRFGTLQNQDSEGPVDFFGIPTLSEPVYVGMGGMQQLPRRILDSSNAKVHRGTRVSSIRKDAKGEKWELLGMVGEAAYHDTKESEASKTTEQVIDTVDAVLLTDISSSAESWHRASAGIPDSLRQQLPPRNRVPLFSCMVALSQPIGDLLPYDGFAVGGNSSLWFASRSQSKPGVPKCNAECWTLISTPSFAVKEISETTLRDPVTGAFRPQENDYLNTTPGPSLFSAFLDAVEPYLEGRSIPEATYLQAQRWGSGIPTPEHISEDIHEILGTRYVSKLHSSLVYPRADDGTKDFIADDSDQIYYAGDFCSHRCPGFEAAALSGVDAAKYIIETVKD
jgi:predicted NAD/FAD-dependent oxidoreductase